MTGKNNGFTLIEMLIVVALLAITVGITSDILISLVRSNTRTQILNEIEQQANFVSLKIEKELRDARDVTQELEGDTLQFTRNDGVEITYEHTTTDGVGFLRRQVGSSGFYPVTSGSGPGAVDVRCSGRCFTVTGANPEVVMIDMEFFQAANGGVIDYIGGAKIQSSIVIRSTY